MANPYENRREQMFPRLTDGQIARMSAIGRRREVRAGEVLAESREQHTNLILVITGSLELVRPAGDREEVITVHGPTRY